MRSLIKFFSGVLVVSCCVFAAKARISLSPTVQPQMTTSYPSQSFDVVRANALTVSNLTVTGASQLGIATTNVSIDALTAQVVTVSNIVAKSIVGAISRTNLYGDDRFNVVIWFNQNGDFTSLRSGTHAIITPLMDGNGSFKAFTLPHPSAGVSGANYVIHAQPAGPWIMKAVSGDVFYPQGTANVTNFSAGTITYFYDGSGHWYQY